MAGQGNKGKGLGGGTKSSSNTASKNKGPKHGHKNKGKGGGGPYGNNIGLTISQAKKLYANHLAGGSSLQQAMASNPAETVSFFDLIDDTKTPTTNSTNNNNTISSSTPYLHVATHK